MSDEKTIFEHEDGSISVRLGILPVSVGMTVFSKPNVPMIVTDVMLHVPCADAEMPEPNIKELVTRLHVKLANHPKPAQCTWSELH